MILPIVALFDERLLRGRVGGLLFFNGFIA